MASLGISNLPLADAVVAPSGSSTQVRIGASIKAIYIEMWYMSDGQQPSIQTTTLEVMPDKTQNMTVVQSNDLHAYRNKNNLLYVTEGLVGDANTNPIPVLKGWFKIPKGKQRMSQDSAIKLNIENPSSEGLSICGQAIYKEYY